MNQVWLYLVLIAHDLIRWTQALLLLDELAKAEPKRLRYIRFEPTVAERIARDVDGYPYFIQTETLAPGETGSGHPALRTAAWREER